MSAIFLSHSSKDNQQAVALKSLLESLGHSVFLDSDPDTGIVGGADWERTLYERLNVCQAVILLLSSDWARSKWCFAEATLARSDGKTIVPVRIGGYEGPRAFPDVQEVDLEADGKDGYPRLREALQTVFPFDASRPPYPGLAAYDEQDAPIFFGRESETVSGIERLETLRRKGRNVPRLLLVLGASGSGKSSLVKAGFMPRLRRTDSDWIVIPAFRPQTESVTELSVALAGAYQAAGQPREWSDIAKTLLDGPTCEGSPVLLRIANDLRACASRPTATVLLVVDQAEELFNTSDSVQATACLKALRAALDRSGSELIVVATLRSDFLGAIQRHWFLREQADSGALAYDQLTVDPMPASRIPQVIRGPAQRTGLGIDNALVEALVSDMRNTAASSGDGVRGGSGPGSAADALPLLAFTLRRLWDTEEYRRDGSLDLKDYNNLGGIGGAIVKAVNDTLDFVSPTTDDWAALQEAFIPGMVRVTAAGTRTRHRALIADLPSRAQPLLRRLVDARLLTTDRDAGGNETIEVAHEALFRMWPRLSRWLEEDQDSLRVIEGLHRAAIEWKAEGSSVDMLVHRDGRLSEALRLIEDEKQARFARSLDSETSDYLAACKAEQQRRDAETRAEEERRLRDARTITRRTKLGLAVAVVLVAALGLALWYVIRSEALARDRSHLVLANDMSDQDPTKAGLVLLELGRPRRMFAVDDPKAHDVAEVDANELRRAAMSVLSHPLARSELQHDGAVLWAEINPGGDRILTTSKDGTARIWRADGGAAPVTLDHRPGELIRAVFSSEGSRVATAAREDEAGTLRVWSLDGKEIVAPHQTQGVVSAVAFSPSGDRIITGSFLGSVEVWQTETSSPPLALHPPGLDEAVVDVSFDTEGNRAMAAFANGKVLVWRLGSTAILGSDVCDYGAPLKEAAFADSGLVLTVVRDGGVHEWARGELGMASDCVSPPIIVGREVPKLQSAAFASGGSAVALFFEDGDVKVWKSPFSGKSIDLVDRSGSASRPRHGSFTAKDRLLIGYDDGTTRIWDLAKPREPITLSGHDGAVRHVAADLEGQLLVTASDDGTARTWGIGDEGLQARHAVTLPHARNVTSVDVSHDGSRVLTSALNGEVHIWSLSGERLGRKLVHYKTAVLRAAFDSTGARVLSVANDGKVRLWRPDEERPKPVVLEDEGGKEEIGAIYADFSPDGARVVATSKDGTARVWRVDQPTKPIHLRGHSPGLAISFAAFDPAGDRVVTASDDGTARLWLTDRESSELEIFRSDHAVRKAVFSSDGSRVATASADGIARVWRPSHDSEPLEFPHGGGALEDVVFSPDNSSLLTAGENGEAKVWRIGKTPRYLSLIGHTEPIVSARFSSDGKLIATASKDKTARLWSSSGSADPVILRGSESALVAAVFDRNGSRLVTGSNDGRAIIWTIAPDDLLALIRAQTDLCLHPGFRQRYFLEDTEEAEAMFRTCEQSHQQNRAR